MSKVTVTVEETELENDRGFPVAGIVVTCGQCDHKVEVFGTTDRSVRRACIMLRESCPDDEENFYTEG